MESGSAVAEKVRQLSASVYPIHERLLQAIQLKRGNDGADIPTASTVVRDAIVRLAADELDRERFEQLMAGVA